MTGWCGVSEDFTYVSVDLGSIHRVKAILVKVRGRGGMTVSAGSVVPVLSTSAQYSTVIQYRISNLIKTVISKMTAGSCFVYLTRLSPNTLYWNCFNFLPLQGVITEDVVGRPTELRFFYKEQESDNYVVYFPNFNLTARDPGETTY